MHFVKTQYPIYWPQFYTATINQWKNLLLDNRFKDIIIDSLKFMVENKRIELNAFVIMSNHIHLIWQALPGHSPSTIQAAFMKYTAQQIKRKLAIENPAVLESCRVNKYDREYQIWKREPLGVELFSESVYWQKMEYIHYNPVAAGLCSFPEEYQYSSASFYYSGINKFGILAHNRKTNPLLPTS